MTKGVEDAGARSGDLGEPAGEEEVVEAGGAVEAGGYAGLFEALEGGLDRGCCAQAAGCGSHVIMI